MNKKLMNYFNVIEKSQARNRAGIGVLSGIIAGGIAALLFAPKSGKETRADLKAQAEIGLDKVRETAEKVKEFAVEKADDVKAGFEKLKSNAKDAAADVAEKVEDTATDIKHDIKGS